MAGAKLTSEQRKFIAEIMAEMMAENAKKTSPRIRKTLTTTHENSSQFNIRLPNELCKTLQGIAEEICATQSYVVYYLIMSSLNKSPGSEYDEMIGTNAVQNLL